MQEHGWMHKALLLRGLVQCRGIARNVVECRGMSWNEGGKKTYWYGALA